MYFDFYYTLPTFLSQHLLSHQIYKIKPFKKSNYSL